MITKLRGDFFTNDSQRQLLVLPEHTDWAITSGVHNKRSVGEYPTLTIPCTNALHKIRSVNHQVLSFCINTFRVTKNLMIGVNSFVRSSLHIDIDNVSFICKSATSKKRLNEFDGRPLRRHNICLSAFFKILLLARGLSGLLTVLLCTIVLVEISFKNSRANSKISEFMHSQAGSTKLLPAMLASQTVDGTLYYLSLYQYGLVLINRVHTCLLSWHKSKHLTPMVITSH